MNWYNPENLSFLIQYIALAFFLASLVVFVFWVALPIHRLVVKLAAYAESRGDVLPGAFKNDADVLVHVFKLLTQDVQRKEKELQELYEHARSRARFMERYSDRLVESIPVALLGFDFSGRLMSMNSTAEKILRIRLSEALDQPPVPRVAVPLHHALRDDLTNIFARGQLIHAGGKEVFGVLGSNAGTAGDVLAVGDAEIDGVLAFDARHALVDGVSAWFSDDVADEEQFHGGNLTMKHTKHTKENNSETW